jgi:ABC-type polysaccharide/polyol phosphate transport system ATPase subunit
MHSTAAIIQLQDVGVKFSVYGGRQTTRNRLRNRFFRPRRSFWALRDVSFTVYRGEAFFVIGRNGAGKTTLLKVLAETLLPDVGKVTVWGEITAFLSMGLGLQPEFSGHDNMELGLQLMGVPSGEIPRLREQIVEFTQLDDFMDMPIKHYSTGMKARLAFAIATSIDPEILIMDEVIGAGDEEFREKCQARLSQMLQKAKALVVCTHNLQNAQALANRVMWIEQGEIRAIGEPQKVVEQYREFAISAWRDPFYDLKARQKRICAA